MEKIWTIIKKPSNKVGRQVILSTFFSLKISVDKYIILLYNINCRKLLKLLNNLQTLEEKQMSIFTERAAIRERVTEIREEKKALNEEYYILLDRLRTLDNEERESIDTESVVGSLTDAVRLLKELVPNVPTDVLISNLAEKVKESGISVTEEEVEMDKPLVPEYIIQEQKYQDSQRHLHEKGKAHERTPAKKGKQYFSKEMSAKVNDRIVEILKERGVPTKLSTIHEMLDKEFEPMSGPTLHGRVKRLEKENPRIEKVVRGVYQYKM